VAVGGFALILIAFTFDAGPLFVVGAALVLLGCGLPAWVWASAEASDVRRRLLCERVLEGQPAEAVIEVRRACLGLPGAELRDPLVQAPIDLALPISPFRRGSRTQLRIVARFPRRGLRVLEAPELVVHDPLRLAKRNRRGSSPNQELLVLPYTEPVRWSHHRGSRPAEGAGGSATAEPFAAVDIDGLRPYRAGTPASRIHWSALARGAGLLERRLRADGDARPLIVLDARGSGPPEHLDAAVRAAASLSLEMARLGGCRLLLPGDRRAVTIEPDLAAWPRVHTRLALIPGGEQATAPALELGARPGAVFYVAARRLDHLPPALASQRAARIIVVPIALAGPAARAASFEVTGCCGMVIGSRTARRSPVAA
jgi:uncharacterized protein (DUF58 family)